MKDSKKNQPKKGTAQLHPRNVRLTHEERWIINAKNVLWDFGTF
jgi:hypothetical protein